MILSCRSLQTLAMLPLSVVCSSTVLTMFRSGVLQLNPDKSELMVFGSQVNLERLASTDVSVRVGQAVVQPSDRVRDFGVILDSSLSMRQHIAKVASTCLFHLRKLRKIGKVIDRDSRNRLVCAFILTRIDYCNAVFAGLPCRLHTCAIATRSSCFILIF